MAPARSCTIVDKYPAKQHAQAVAARLGDPDALIYLLGQYDLPSEDSDQSRAWKQRRYFYYCSGVNVPDCCLLYDVSKDELVLYIPAIRPERVVWTGRGPTIQEALEMYDVDHVRLNSQLFDDLDLWKTKNPDSTFYILHPDHRPTIEFPKVDDEKLQVAIDQCRTVKDAHEVGLIREANRVSTICHEAVLKNIHRFTNESQVAGVFTYAAISNFAELAYPVIAGGGEHAAELHYTKCNAPLKGRQLLCIDAGAEVGLYASDVTRTFPISGSWPSEESKAIYAIVQEMQETCISLLKPGVKMITLHVLAHSIAIKGLLKLGILHNGSPSEIYAAGTSRGFFPHGLGHHVGLEVHDVNNIPTMRYRSTINDLIIEDECPVLDSKIALAPCAPRQPSLEENMVVTIEPGIYFSRYELNRAYIYDPTHSKFINKDVLNKYWAVGGVRIEDDILITMNGHENLTTTPKGEAANKMIRDAMSAKV
ncbi:hypothetical protein MMC25_003682 [Agyrium rufum]|nr:hypothetical protein [Agyrium rufum]